MKTQFIAHRGASGIEQENTIPAFIAAGNRSYFGIECDVHVTRDGKYVIYHDDETSRLCNKALLIEESSFSELRSLCLKEHGGESFDERLIIPTLEEYLDIVASCGKTAVIELKRPMPESNIREITEICKKHYALEKIIFISFSFDNLLTVRKILPNQKLQFLTCECTLNTIIPLLKAHSVDLDILYTALDKPMVDTLHSHGISINCWTCDEKHEAQKLMGWGVDYITSNILGEDGRRPWLYRNGGAGIVRFDKDMPYPRVCAHRGFNTVAPENSMPAWGAAVALGAEEIEFDLWTTQDGVIVSCHDQTLDRVSDGTGKIGEHTYEELLHFDFGVKHGEKFKGLKISTFEEILKQFASRTIMNIHVKIWDEYAENDKLDEIAGLICKYDCEKHCYFMSGNDTALKKAKEKYPLIGICLGAGVGGQDPWKLVDKAIEIKADKVQLFKPYFNQSMIDKARANGIRCNVFWADDPKEAVEMIKSGIDCVLTNDYLAVKTSVDKYLGR